MFFKQAFRLIEPKDTLSFLNWTKDAHMRQNAGFSSAARLLRSKERSQSVDRLWVRQEDEN